MPHQLICINPRLQTVIHIQIVLGYIVLRFSMLWYVALKRNLVILLITFCYLTLGCIILSLCFLIVFSVMLCYVMLRYVITHCAALRYVTLCYAMLCYAMLCYARPCNFILYCINIITYIIYCLCKHLCTYTHI